MTLIQPFILNSPNVNNSHLRANKYECLRVYRGIVAHILHILIVYFIRLRELFVIIFDVIIVENAIKRGKRKPPSYMKTFSRKVYPQTENDKGLRCKGDDEKCNPMLLNSLAWIEYAKLCKTMYT